jgi:hypothetical protein
VSLLAQETPEALNLNYFDQNLIEKVIETCKLKPSDQAMISSMSNLKLFDLKKIKTILTNEIGDTSQAASSSKINLIIELKYILKNVYERNQFQLEFLHKKKHLDSFKTFIETVVLLTPCDVFGLSMRFIIASLIFCSFYVLNQKIN